MGSLRAPSPLRMTQLQGEVPHVPERSGSYSSSRSATLETAPPETPSTASPDDEEYTVRIAIDSRDHPEQLSPVVRESVLFGEDEQALAPLQGTSPLNIRKSPSVMETRMDGHEPTSPVRSERSSETSPKSFSFGVEDADESSRLSLDMSAGVEGIGLSLLQGFITGGNGDDGASMFSSRSGANSPDHRQSVASTVNPAPEGPPMESPRSATQSMSHYSRTPSPVPAADEFEPPKPPYALESQRSSMQSLKSTRSLQSLRPSLAGSENSGGSGSGWEGDIYDDYRYSRFSMASKISGARLSQSSIKPMGESLRHRKTKEKRKRNTMTKGNWGTGKGIRDIISYKREKHYFLSRQQPLSIR